MCTVQKNKKDIMGKTVVFAVMTAVLIYCFGNGISGNDFWWHMKVGEWICEHGTIPKTDIFSWYGMEQGISWTAHEWLSDVLYYLLFHFGGEAGVFVFSFLAAVVMVILVWKQVEPYIMNNLLLSGVFLPLFALVASVFFYGRPHVFSFFLLYFELKCLYVFWENNSSRSIYVIPFLACLWSNLHGGSSNLSYLLCGVFLIAGLFSWKIGCIQAEKMSVKGLVKLFGVMIASATAILLNPAGWEMLKYPYVNMGDQFMLSIISEWNAPDAKNMGELLIYFLPICLMIIGFFAEQEKIRFLDLLLMGLFLLLFLRSKRFIILWFIGAAFCAVPYMPLCTVKEVRSKMEKAAVYLFLVVTLIPMGLGIRNMYQNYKEEKLVSKVMTDEMAQLIKEEEPKRILNDYNLGEALIYYDIEVFVDGRADMYAADNILKDAVSLMYLVQQNQEEETSYVDVERLFQKYRFDAVVMLKDRAFYSYMISHPERFDLVFEDDTSGYFRVIL